MWEDIAADEDDLVFALLKKKENNEELEGGGSDVPLSLEDAKMGEIGKKGMERLALTQWHAVYRHWRSQYNSLKRKIRALRRVDTAEDVFFLLPFGKQLVSWVLW